MTRVNAGGTVATPGDDKSECWWNSGHPWRERESAGGTVATPGDDKRERECN